MSLGIQFKEVTALNHLFGHAGDGHLNFLQNGQLSHPYRAYQICNCGISYPSIIRRFLIPITFRQQISHRHICISADRVKGAAGESYRGTGACLQPTEGAAGDLRGSTASSHHIDAYFSGWSLDGAAGNRGKAAVHIERGNPIRAACLAELYRTSGHGKCTGLHIYAIDPIRGNGTMGQRCSTTIYLKTTGGTFQSSALHCKCTTVYTDGITGAAFDGSALQRKRALAQQDGDRVVCAAGGQGVIPAVPGNVGIGIIDGECGHFCISQQMDGSGLAINCIQGGVDIRIGSGCFSNGDAGHRGSVIGGTQSQDITTVQIDHIGIICISNGRAEIKCIPIGYTASGRCFQEQLIWVADGIPVAVCHIHQVVLALQGDDVPHMSALTGASSHLTGHGIADGAIKFGQVAQVLEGLGITLTDHFGVGIIVKDVDDLPGVAIRGITITCGIIIIRNQFTDLVFIGFQLLVVGFVLVLFYNGLGICRRGICGSSHGRINRNIISVLITLGDIEDGSQRCELIYTTL